MNLVIEKNETVFFLCRVEAYFGPEITNGRNRVGGNAVVHLYGNMEELSTSEPSASEPTAKRARVDGSVASGNTAHSDFR